MGRASPIVTSAVAGCTGGGRPAQHVDHLCRRDSPAVVAVHPPLVTSRENVAICRSSAACWCLLDSSPAGLDFRWTTERAKRWLAADAGAYVERWTVTWAAMSPAPRERGEDVKSALDSAETTGPQWSPHPSGVRVPRFVRTGATCRSRLGLPGQPGHPSLRVEADQCGFHLAVRGSADDSAAQR